MVIIIGASSFIGVHTVAKFLSEGCKVAVTGRNNKFKSHYDKWGVDYYNLDLSNKDDFEPMTQEQITSAKYKQAFEAAGHCAAYTFGDEDIFVCHGYSIAHKGASILVQRPIVWTSDGWPQLK